METLPIPRTTLADMVNAYVLAEQEIRQAYGLLVQADQRLKSAFRPDSYLFDLSRVDRDYRDFENPAGVMKRVRQDVWRALVDRMELKRILSVKRTAELERQIETGENLPEITLPNLLAMLEGTLNQASAYLEEAVREVFEWLRPPGSPYKTNSEFEVGRRVIRSYAVELGWNGKFRMNHYRHDQLRALDRVFHALDGQGYPATYNGPLADAIEATPDGTGETDYFKFRCFKNGNLHLEFKRLDLVAKLNQVAGGMRLRGPTPCV